MLWINCMYVYNFIYVSLCIIYSLYLSIGENLEPKMFMVIISGTFADLYSLGSPPPTSLYYLIVHSKQFYSVLICIISFWGWGKREYNTGIRILINDEIIKISAVSSLLLQMCKRVVPMALKLFLFMKSLLHARHCIKNLKHYTK